MIWIFWVLGVLLCLASAALFRSEYEKKHPVITYYEVPSSKLPQSFDGYRILFLSDLHGTDFSENREDFLRMIRETPYDAVLMGGDMVTVKHNKKDFSFFEEMLSAISEGTPIFMGRGNHELRMRMKAASYPGWEHEFLAILRAHHVTYLEGTSDVIEKDGEKIGIYGTEVPSAYYLAGRKRTFEPEKVKALPERDGLFHVVMLHSPLYREEISEAGADLSLSGHFHGGTVYLGPLGGLMTPQYQFFSKNCRGMEQYGDCYSIVSAGLGTHSINIRLFNKPEIVLVTLKRVEHAD